ncbi:MAG: hypothetical protein QXO25_03345 [Candidatus Bathyarchaeia archaeon]
MKPHKPFWNRLETLDEKPLYPVYVIRIVHRLAGSMTGCSRSSTGFQREMPKRFDSSSFADKILAASSLASEGSRGEIEFAFTERALREPSIRKRLQSYAEQHAHEGFAFDEYLSIKSSLEVGSSGRLRLHRGAFSRPLDEMVRGFLMHLSEAGRLEELVQYVLAHVTPRRQETFYTRSADAESMEPNMREILSSVESRWAELPEFGQQLLTMTFLIENDNSYEIEVEDTVGLFRGKLEKAKEIADSIFQSRLKLVRKFTL